MAFWTVYNSRWFHKENKEIENQIEIFRKQLQDDMYNCLTEDEKEQLRKQQIEAETSYQKALVALSYMGLKV